MAQPGFEAMEYEAHWWQPTSVYLPGKFRGQMSLMGYGPWGGKESDTTEHMGQAHRAGSRFLGLKQCHAASVLHFDKQSKTKI